MATVTHDDLRAAYPHVLPTDSDASLNLAIETAKLTVDGFLANGCMGTYSDERLHKIMTYLAAHYFQVQTGVLNQKGAGVANESWTMPTDFFLKNTLHGQQAMLLDTQHCLATMVADTDLALQGKNSFQPMVVALPSRERQPRRYGC